jgi:hypothetical protein
MNPLYLAAAMLACYSNNNSAFIPEVWAMEGLVILEENMVFANLVHRDFENQVREFGDVVNTRRPGAFIPMRKTDTDTVVNQDAVSTNVQVPLNQHFYCSFTINDGEASQSFQELVDIYLLPGMQSIARSVDRAVTGVIPAFLGGPNGRSGQLNNLNSSNAQTYGLQARQILNQNKAYMQNRNLVLSPGSETAFLNTPIFVKANERGDGGTALENATLGRILGFNTYMDQNVPFISSGDTPSGANGGAGVVTNALAAGAGGSQAVTGITGAWVTGAFAVVAGNNQPTYVTAHTETTGNTTAFTLNEANANATAASAAVTYYKPVASYVTYAAGYAKEISVSGFTSGSPPQVGQLIAWGTSPRATYVIISSRPDPNVSGNQALLLDRPLDNAINTADPGFPGPVGSYNFAFHREAVALVTRPLALPNSRMGVMADVGVHNDVAMRVTMQYSIQNQGTIVVLDILAGVAQLDQNLGVVLLG